MPSVARFLTAFITLVVVSLPAPCEGSTYEQQTAELIRPRGGLPNVLAKLRNGREVAVAYLGGSITAQNGWRPMTLEWFGKTFPKAKLREINAAIGGTGSTLGAFRLKQDVLVRKPDLVFVEFAVNDGGQKPENIWASMEGIVRQIWRQDPSIDICYVYTIHTRGMPNDLKKGLCPRSSSAMEMIAEHYSIPSINMGLKVVQLHEAGKLYYKPKTGEPGQKVKAQEGVIVFANDDCHPRREGHEVYTELITKAIKQFEGIGKPGPHAVKAPFVADNLENAGMVPVSRIEMQGQWTRLDPKTGIARRFSKFMPELWECRKPGGKISFRFRGSRCGIFDIVGPDGGQVSVTIDGKTTRRARFDHYCKYHRMQKFEIAGGLDPDREHLVTVELLPEPPDRSKVIESEKKECIARKRKFDPAKYQGTVLRFSGIMLVGTIVE